MGTGTLVHSLGSMNLSPMIFLCYLNNYPFVVRMTGVVASWQLANDLLPVSKRSYGYWQKSF